VNNLVVKRIDPFYSWVYGHMMHCVVYGIIDSTCDLLNSLIPRKKSRVVVDGRCRFSISKPLGTVSLEIERSLGRIVVNVKL
jgi:hypothetical protein